MGRRLGTGIDYREETTTTTPTRTTTSVARDAASIPRAAAADADTVAVTVTKIAATAPGWAGYRGRILIHWQREGGYGTYYEVAGTDIAARAIDAAVAHIQRYDPPEIAETRRGDTLACYVARAVSELVAEHRGSNLEALLTSTYPDPDEVLLVELGAEEITWQPSEPPCIDGEGRKRATHQWAGPETLGWSGGGMASIAACRRDGCAVERVIVTYPVDPDGDPPRAYPTLVEAYTEHGEPLLRDGVAD